MEISEELFGTSFDLLSGRDMLRFLLSLGAVEIEGGGEVGALAAAPAAGVPGASLAVPGFALAGAIGGAMLATGQFCIVMSLWVLLKALSFFVRRLRRPVYYPKERLLRRKLARDRRRIRDRFTLNPCPDAKSLTAQFAKVRRNAREAIRFGSMLCDLEAYCDNSLIRNVDGEIVARNAGVKGWLKANCPELAAHYKNVMHYKAMAEKFRQAVGVGDPVPAAALADRDDGAVKALLTKSGNRKITVRNKKGTDGRRGEAAGRTFTLDADEVTAAWRRAQVVLTTCEETPPQISGYGSNHEVLRDGDGLKHGHIERGPVAKTGDNVKMRLRYGSLSGLEKVMAKMLDPEFAPAGWKIDSMAPPETDGRAKPRAMA